MSNCTIITIWNDEDLFRAFTQALEEQKDVSCTLLDIDNRDGHFDGARAAFNAYLDQAQTRWVLFAHQDIRFLNDHALQDILLALEELDGAGVVGVAGCPAGNRWEILSCIVHGQEKRCAGTPVQEAAAVQTVDECLFAMEMETLQTLRFTEQAGWHLYAVEQCIRTQRMGLTNYVIPAKLWHLSDGASLDPSYIPMLLQLGRRYQLGLLNTTVKQWDPGTPKGRLYIRYYYRKQQCKKALKRLGLLKGR